MMRPAALVLVFVASLLLTACGGSDDGDGSNRSSATSTPNGGGAAATVAASPEATEPEAEATEPEAEATVTTAATTEPTAETTAVEATATSPAASPTTAAPAASPTQAAGDPDVVVGKSTLVTDQYGITTAMGDLINQGGGDAVSVEVVVTLKDAGGSILASQSAIYGGPVRAGGKAAWSVSFTEVDTAQVATTDLIVQWEGFTDSFFETIYTDSFTSSNVQWTADLLVGEVTNTGDAPAELVQIVLIGYDAAGEVMAVERTFAQLDTIAPGAVSPFSVPLLSDAVAPATFEIFIYGHIAD